MKLERVERRVLQNSYFESFETAEFEKNQYLEAYIRSGNLFVIIERKAHLDRGPQGPWDQVKRQVRFPEPTLTIEKANTWWLHYSLHFTLVTILGIRDGMGIEPKE